MLSRVPDTTTLKAGARMLRRWGDATASKAGPWSVLASVAVHAVALGGVAWITLATSQRASPSPAVVGLESASAPRFEPRRDEPLVRELDSEPFLEPTLVEQELPPLPLEPVALDPNPRAVFDDSRLDVHIAMRWPGAPARVEKLTPSVPPVPVELARAVAPAVEPESRPALPVELPATLVQRVEPDYPRMSRRLTEEGTVTVRIRVGTDGRVLEATVALSSGYARLDTAAVAAIEQWVFDPATRDATPIEWVIDHRVTFQLEDGD